MKRTTPAGLSLALLLAVLVLVALVVFRRQVRGAWQFVRNVRQMRQDVAEGRRFPQELAAAKAQGIPTSMADLQKPLPPPGQNAAPVYTDLMNLLKAHPLTAQEQTTLMVSRGTMPSQAQWAQIAAVLHKRADVMRLVHQAAARPQCVFQRNWTTPDPLDITFPELATVRVSAVLLDAESLLMAHQGRIQAAVQNQALGFNVARHIASDNTQRAYLDGVAVDAITLEGLKRILYLAGPNAAVANAIRSVITRDWKPRSLASALKTETTFGLGVIANLRKAGLAGVDRAGDAKTVPLQGRGAKGWNALMDYNGVFILREMERAIGVADHPYSEAKPVLDQVETDCGDQRHIARFPAEIVISVSSSGALHRAQMQVLMNVDLAGAAVLIQEAHTGHPPDTLPSPVSDPFTGNPLKYRREGAAGFVIYSVGEDGHFDGGKPGEYHWKPPQTAFRYPGPPAAH